MSTIATLMVKIMGDASGFSQAVGSATKTAGGFSKSMKEIGGAVTGFGAKMTAGVTLPIAAMGLASISAASDLRESMNKVDVVFGDSAAQIQKWAETSATAFGQSKQQALEATGTFGNLFTSMGIGVDKSTEMSMSLVELASDLASFNNIDPTIALEKLRAGLVGEVEPLRTLGVNLSATATKAKALEMGLADSAEALTPAMLAQARYALILEQTANAQGDFARTSKDLANATRIAKAQFADARAELGQHLLPIALKVVTAINKLLGVFNNLPAPAQKMILIFGAIAAAIGPALIIIGQIISAIGALGGVLAGVGAAIGSVAAPILIVIAVLAALYLAWKHNFLGIRDVVDVVWNAIQATFQRIKQIVSSVAGFLKGELTFDQMVGQIQHQLEAIGAIWERVWGKISSFAQEVGPRIGELFTRAFTAILESVGISSERAQEIIQTAWTNIKNFFKTVWDGIRTIVQAGIEYIKGYIAVALQILAGDWAGAWETVKSTALRVWDTINTGVFQKVGTLVSNIVAKIIELKDKVLGFLGQLTDGFLGKLGELVSKGAELIGGLVGKIFGGRGGAEAGGGFTLDFGAILELKNNIVEAMTGIRESITTTTSTTQTIIMAWLAVLRNNVTTTFSELQMWIATWLQTLATNITTFTTSTLAIVNAWLQALHANSVAMLSALMAFVLSWLAAVKSNIMATNRAIMANYTTTWRAILATVTNIATQMRNTVVSLMEDMRSKVVGILQGLASDARRSGEAIAEGVASGIRARTGSAVAAALAMAAAVRAALPSSDAKIGPLSDLMASGRALPETFARGILMNQRAAARAANSMAANVRRAMGTDLPIVTGPNGARLPAANVPARVAGRGGSNDRGGGGQVVNVTINNPRGEPSENSLVRQLRNLAYIGVLDPVSSSNAQPAPAAPSGNAPAPALPTSNVGY